MGPDESVRVAPHNPACVSPAAPQTQAMANTPLTEPPAIVATLSSALSSLPPTLTSANISLLANLFTTFSKDVTPVLGTLAGGFQERVMANTTWLAANLAQLEGVVAMLPRETVQGATQEELLEIIRFGTTRYDVMTVGFWIWWTGASTRAYGGLFSQYWSPDCWAALTMFVFAFLLKLSTLAVFRSKCVERVRQASLQSERGDLSLDAARGSLDRPGRAACALLPVLQANEKRTLTPSSARRTAHGMNFVVSSIVLGIQFAAWRLFVLPGW